MFDTEQNETKPPRYIGGGHKAPTLILPERGSKEIPPSRQTLGFFRLRRQ